MCQPPYCTICPHTCHPLEKFYIARVFYPWRRFFIGSRVGQQGHAYWSLWTHTKIEVISKLYRVSGTLLQVVVTPQAPIVSELS